MSRVGRSLTRESGQAMVLVLFTVALLTALAVALTDVVSGGTVASGAAVQSNASYQAAEAGVDRYLSKLLDDTEYYLQYVDPAEATRGSGSNTAGVTSTCTSSSMPTPISWSYGTTWTYPDGKNQWCQLGNGYEYDLEITPPSASQPDIQLISTGQMVGSTSIGTERVIQVLVQPSSVADYFQLVDNDVTFGSDANVDAPVYSPGGSITFESGGSTTEPVYGCFGVSGVSAGLSYTGSAGGTVGPASLDQSCETRDDPTYSQASVWSGILADGALSYLPNAAEYGGGVYINDANVAAVKLVFSSNGTFTEYGCGTASQANTSYDQGTTTPTCSTAITVSGCPSDTCTVPTNGAVYVAQDAIVSGSAKGRVTVESGGDVVLAAPINPVTAGTDVIGLVAADNLVFAGYATNATFNFDASVITEGSNSNAYNPSGNASGEFETYNQSGSASMTWTGSAMDFTGGDMVGFASRSYDYDSTLQYLPPPWWPYIAQPYEVTLFRELPPT